MVFMTLT